MRRMKLFEIVPVPASVLSVSTNKRHERAANTME